MIQTFTIQSRFGREIETALTESFYDAFGKNIKDCKVGEVQRNVFILPPEKNMFLWNKYFYKGFCFLKVKGYVEINDKEITFKLQINKYKPNYGNS